MKGAIGLFYQLTVRDKSGEVVRQTLLRRCRSFILQFLQLVEIQMFQVTVSTKDTGGVARTPALHAMNLSVNAAAGTATYGTIIGTGTTSPANNDYVMEIPIAEGVGAGQMSYGGQSKITTTIVGANVDFVLARAILNASGGTINVTEAGLGMLMTGPYTFLVIHDTFTAVPVANTETLTVTYTLRTAV